VASIIGLCPSMKNPRLRRGIFILSFLYCGGAKRVL
jgi:hypothetical protein